MLTAVGGLEQPAPGTARAEGPTLPPEVPRGGVERPRVLAAHGDHAAAGREVRARQHLSPALAAVGRLVDAALGAVVPEVARRAGVDRVAVPGVHEDPRDALGVLEPDVLPVLAAVGRLVDPVADRSAVPRPRLAGADPDVLRVAGIDGHRADRLRPFLVEDGLERRAAVDGFPHAAARRADVHRQAAALVDGRQGGDAAAHRRGADVAGGESRDGAGVVADGRLRGGRGRDQQRSGRGPGPDGVHEVVAGSHRARILSREAWAS